MQRQRRMQTGSVRQQLRFCFVFVLWAELMALGLATPLCAQAQQPSGTAGVPLDVIVQDAAGRPVHGLSAGDFTLQIDGSPRQLLRVEERRADQLPADPPLPAMPPGIYTDYTPVAPDATLNVLLYDALNTPAKEQAALRAQLRTFVEQNKPGSHLAIVGLANQLILLQGFTSNPATLRAVVEHRLIPRPGEALRTQPPPDGESIPPALLTRGDLQPSGPAGAAPDMTQIAANMQEFDAQLRSPQQSMHAQYTLDALDTLAHYLATLPGHKNVLWFSGGFRAGTIPASLPTSLAAALSAGAPTGKDAALDPTELQETAALLAQGRVALYPLALEPTAGTTTMSNATMQALKDLATATGGRALLNIPNLAEGVAEAIRAGSNYYALTYATAPAASSETRERVHVSLRTASSTPQQLSYRTLAPGTASDRVNDAANTDAHTSATTRAALARGAPEPQGMLFKVRVRLAGTTPETTVAAGNDLDPLVRRTGPFHRYNVDIATTPADITMVPQPNGTHTGSVVFTVLVYNRDGRLLNSISKRYEMKLTPATYAAFEHQSLVCHMEISTPDAADSFLRIAVEDRPSHRLGVVEVPASDVRSLPVLNEDQPTPTTSTTGPHAGTAPSTSAVPHVTPSAGPGR